MTISSKQAEVFRFKMRSLTLPVVHLLSDHLTLIEEQLEIQKKQTPYLFQDSPMIVDLDEINDIKLDLTALYSLLRRYGIVPVGIQLGKDAEDKNVVAHYEAEAKAAGMAIFGSARLTDHHAPMKESTASPSVATSKSIKERYITVPSKLITKPIRSGQQVYAEGGDLIVVASVSTGAELLADGNIHVYGTLRGRALAGIQGNAEARIFCQDLDADLLSIAGHYVLSDTIERYKQQGAQQVFWQNDKLQIQSV